MKKLEKQMMLKKKKAKSSNRKMTQIKRTLIIEKRGKQIRLNDYVQMNIVPVLTFNKIIICCCPYRFFSRKFVTELDGKINKN